MDPEDDKEDRMDSKEKGEYSQPRSGWTPPNGTWSGQLPYAWTSGNASSKSNETSRPSTASGHQYNYENRIRRRRKSHGSSGSSSQSSSSENSDNDNDDQNRMDDDQNSMEELAIPQSAPRYLPLNSAYNIPPPVPRQARLWRRMPRDTAFETRGRGQSLDPVRFRTDTEGKISRSRSPVRSRSLGGPSDRTFGRHIKPFQRVPGWSTGVGMDEDFPHANRIDRMSNSTSYAEDLTHIPPPDHRHRLHHSSFGENHSRRSTSSPSGSRSTHSPLPNILNSPSTSEDPYEVDMQTRGRPSSFAFGGGHLRSSDQATTSFAFGRDMPSHNQNAVEFNMRDEVPFFTPSRGDIIVMQPPQRGRRKHSFHPSLVITFNDRFGFSNGDLIVRIGTYAHRRHGEEDLYDYIPYRILELYRRHDGAWTFLGDAHSQEDLGLKRRISGLDPPPFRCTSGEPCYIEPNWGDFIIRQHNIRHGEQGQGSIEDVLLGLGLSHDVALPVIDWWTPNLPEEVNMAYPHNTILLRPYLRDPNLFRAREEWLRTPDVVRWDYVNERAMGQGSIVKVWPESILHDRPLPRDSEPLDVLGPFRVGVTVLNPPGSEVEEETAAWPLTSTLFLNARNKKPLYDYLSDEEREALDTEPWGIIEMYTYSAGVQPGWVYWGSSRHICDNSYP